jgi:hypothetical protein
MQGLDIASGLLNFWRLFLSGDISVHTNHQHGYRTTEVGGEAVKWTVERREKETTRRSKDKQPFAQQEDQAPGIPEEVAHMGASARHQESPAGKRCTGPVW